MRVQDGCLRAAFVALCLLPFAAPLSALAGGFYIPQQDVQGIGRAFAGDAAGLDDPSTIFTNPAGMTLLDKAQISVGISGVKPTMHLQNQGSTAATPGTLGMAVPILGDDGGDPGSWNPVPNLYAALPAAGGDLWLGIGVTAPFGLSLEYDPTWFGRYDSIESKLLTIDIAPSIAYKIGDVLSVGGGIDVQYADATLSNALPNTLLPGGPSAATDGLATIKESSWAVGFNLGLLLRPLPGTRLGLTYRYGITQGLQGDTTISGLTGPLAGQNGVFSSSTALNLPSIVSFGLAQAITPDLTMRAGVQWFGWNSFNELRVQFADGRPDTVIPEGYRNTWTANIGADYRWNDDLTLRAGFQFDETPTVDAFRSTGLPDGNRYWIAIGASYSFSGRASIDAAYAHAFFTDGAVDLGRTFYAGTPAQGTFVTKAVAASSADSVSLSFRYRF
ncbi:MAG TPA: outer membrane protein transport protein [Dongiaceae bacterium]|nr:outer membrane protein transport protein [Dongiaceae bacterium]